LPEPALVEPGEQVRAVGLRVMLAAAQDDLAVRLLNHRKDLARQRIHRLAGGAEGRIDIAVGGVAHDVLAVVEDDFPIALHNELRVVGLRGDAENSVIAEAVVQRAVGVESRDVNVRGRRVLIELLGAGHDLSVRQHLDVEDALRVLVEPAVHGSLVAETFVEGSVGVKLREETIRIGRLLHAKTAGDEELVAGQNLTIVNVDVESLGL
jgi:hypothetical protein